MHKSLIAIMTTLDQERAAILTGQFEVIDSLSAIKTAQLTQLQNMSKSEARMLHSTIERNQTLLSATIDGIKSAQKHLQDLREANESLCVYSPWGMQKIRNTKGSELSKKA